MAIDYERAVGVLNDMSDADIQAMLTDMFDKHVQAFYDEMDRGLFDALQLTAHNYIGNDFRVRAYFDVKARHVATAQEV